MKISFISNVILILYVQFVQMVLSKTISHIHEIVFGIGFNDNRHGFFQMFLHFFFFFGLVFETSVIENNAKTFNIHPVAMVIFPCAGLIKYALYSWTVKGLVSVTRT